jgi:hypothetical protein
MFPFSTAPSACPSLCRPLYARLPMRHWPTCLSRSAASSSTLASIRAQQRLGRYRAYACPLERLNVFPLAVDLPAHALNFGSDLGELHGPTSLAGTGRIRPLAVSKKRPLKHGSEIRTLRLEPFPRGRLVFIRPGLFQCWGEAPIGTPPCHPSGV